MSIGHRAAPIERLQVSKFLHFVPIYLYHHATNGSHSTIMR